MIDEPASLLPRCALTLALAVAALLPTLGSGQDKVPAPSSVPSNPVSYTHLDVYKRQMQNMLLKEKK